MSSEKPKKKHFTMVVGYPGKEGTYCRNDIPELGGCGKLIGKNEPCITVSGYNISFRQHVACHLKWLEDMVARAKPYERKVSAKPAPAAEEKK